MSRAKTERLLNLVIALLATRRYLTIEEIRRAVPQYGEDHEDATGEAYRRMFERDKEDLREIGIPLETGNIGGWDDEIGYRIPPAAYSLPDVHLEPEEAAAVALAARAWRSAQLAPAAADALRKLSAAGMPADRPALFGFEPQVNATEPAFEAMLSAVRRRAPVRFGYRAAAASAPVERRLQPWGVVSWHGRWYAVGHDPDRGEQRVFRLSRVVGEVRPDGGDDTVVIPDGVDLAAAVRRYAEEQPIGEARLRVREGRGHDLRRGARVWPDEPGWELVELGFGDPERLADRIAAHGSDVVALAPPELRAAVLRRLRALAEQVG